MKSMELLTLEPHQSAEIVVPVDLEAYCTPHKKTWVNSINGKSLRIATGHVPVSLEDTWSQRLTLAVNVCSQATDLKGSKAFLTV